MEESKVCAELKAVMQQMEKDFIPENAAGLKTVVQLDVTGAGGGQYIISIADQKVKIVEGKAKQPNLTASIALEDWLKIRRGELDPAMAYITGKYVVKGDISNITIFPKIFGR